MNAALVKHNSIGRVYWFSVPSGLENTLKMGSAVMCDTKHGLRHGIVKALAYNVDKCTDYIVRDGAKFPLRKILYELEEIPMSDIIIPKIFQKHTPHIDKLHKRFVEHKDIGWFDTNVAVMHRGGKYILMDGYTAYLASYLLDIPYLLCKVVEIGETN